MVRKLDESDFRAARYILRPDDFALTDDEPDSEPTDLISEQAWHGIITLPSDVAIRTTSYQGARVELLYDLTGAWTEAFTDVGIVNEAMLEGFDCLQSSLFNLVHGYYREALAALRTLLETMAFGVSCSVSGDNASWNEWFEGDHVKFGAACERIRGLDPCKAIDVDAEHVIGMSLLAKQVGWTADLYRRLSGYSHGRGDATNGRLWSSNGPVYSADGFKITYQTFLEAYAICLLLAKAAEPKLPISDNARLILRADSLIEYADKAFAEVGMFYVSRLCP